MKKKVLIAVMSLCMVLTCMPQNAEITFAASGRTESNAAAELQSGAIGEGHNCGYSRPEGVCVPISAPSVKSTNRIAMRNAVSEQFAYQPISDVAAEDTERIGKQYLKKLKNASSLIYVYEKIAEAIDCRAESVKFTWDENSGITDEEADMVYYLVKEDYPEFFWWGNGTYINYVYVGGNKIAEIAFVGDAKDSEGNPLFYVSTVMGIV